MSTEESVHLVRVKTEDEEEINDNYNCHDCNDSSPSCGGKELSNATDHDQGIGKTHIKIEVTDWGYNHVETVADDPNREDTENKVEENLVSSEDAKRDADSGLVLALEPHQPIYEDQPDKAVEDWDQQFTGTKRYHCEYCSSKFSQRGHLNEHMRRHTGERPYVCHECNQTFTRADTLTTHVRIHSGLKPFVCDYCGAGFSRRDSLARHVRYHVGAKPFCCKVCGVQYTEGSTLRRHMRKHTGERPYSCPYCQKTFAINHSLKRHISSHTGNKDYSCGICGEKFTRRYFVTKHIEKKHPDYVKEQEVEGKGEDATVECEGDREAKVVVLLEDVRG